MINKVSMIYLPAISKGSLIVKWHQIYNAAEFIVKWNKFMWINCAEHLFPTQYCILRNLQINFSIWVPSI